MFEKMKKKHFVTSGAPCAWCAISVFHTNGAPTDGAPLVYSNGAPHVWCAISVNSIYSPFPSSVGSRKGMIKVLLALLMIHKT